MRSLVFVFILFAFLVIPISGAMANNPYPCTENLVAVMTDSGMTNNESERVCYVAKYYINEDSKLSRKDAIMKALRRVGVWNAKAIENISKALNPQDNAEATARKENLKKKDESRTFIKFELDSWGDRHLEAQLEDENGISWNANGNDANTSSTSSYRTDKADGRTWIDDSEDKSLFENASENVGVIFGLDFKF